MSAREIVRNYVKEKPARGEGVASMTARPCAPGRDRARMSERAFVEMRSVRHARARP
jgi:hypothetical protein